MSVGCNNGTAAAREFNSRYKKHDNVQGNERTGKVLVGIYSTAGHRCGIHLEEMRQLTERLSEQAPNAYRLNRTKMRFSLS